MSGKLILIPTPIDEEHQLESSALSLLNAIDENCGIIVEEAKIARRRWIRWGLDRKHIDDFILYNEHTRNDLIPDLIKRLKSGNTLYMMSDCGLPAFCDPGRLLVNACHENSIKVTSTMFANSIALAISLSGYKHERFIFEGFIPARGSERKDSLKSILKRKEMSIIMDTPYRLNSLVDEMKSINPNREVFIGLNLNCTDEKLIRKTLKNLNLEKQKNEFVLITRPLDE